VVVDMVPFLVTANDYCRGILPNISLLAASLGAAGATVAWVLPGGGWSGRPRGRVLRPGDRRAVPPLGWPADLLVEKTAASAFFRDREHNATLHTVYRTFGDVRTTAEVVGLIEVSGRPVGAPG
jgi:hypothetical protein